MVKMEKKRLSQVFSLLSGSVLHETSFFSYIWSKALIISSLSMLFSNHAEVFTFKFFTTHLK
jgi:hypothetical protein